MVFGEAAAKKNGVDWEASGAAFFYTNTNEFIGLKIGTVNENGFERECISFNEIPPKVGKYKIINASSDPDDELVEANYFISTADGDVLSAIYIVNESNSNKVEITAIDTVAGTVQGTFSVKFEQNPDKHTPDYPDKVKFKNGTFDVQLVQ